MKHLLFIFMITSLSFFSLQAEELKQRTLLIFSADWCGACNKASKDMKDNEKTEKLLENYHLIYADFDKNTDLVSHYKVKKIPTFLIIDYNGEEFARYTGYTTIEKLNLFLEKPEKKFKSQP